MRRKNTFIFYKEKSKHLVNKTVTGIIAYEKGKKVKSQKLKVKNPVFENASWLCSVIKHFHFSF